MRCNKSNVFITRTEETPSVFSGAARAFCLSFQRQQNANFSNLIFFSKTTSYPSDPLTSMPF
jgi:hypothetical protein